MKRRVLYLFLIYIIASNGVNGQSVTQSKHNLSFSGLKTVKSAGNSEICIFCHTSHTSNPKAPMWNQKISGTIYTLYDSSTLDAKPGQPDGTSILCLSCHDGTIALGNTLTNSNSRLSLAVNKEQRGNLGTDLSDDHPISFVYDKDLTIEDTRLKDPASLAKHVLDNNEKMQCTSCHDPHKDLEGNFLKISNKFSNLCFSCHDTEYWGNSSHNTSTNTWNGILPNPWKHIEEPYDDVSKNACSNCHDVHNASGNERLLKSENEEDNCLDCHNGNLARTDIESEFSKPYRHNIYAYTGIHDPMEYNLNSLAPVNGSSLASVNGSKHIECVDCHNAHASNNKDSEAPFVKGSNFGVNGITNNGSPINQVNYEYEICFKCHADNQMADLPNTDRYLGSLNTRIDFDSNNISYHPVTAIGKNIRPRGLIEPYSENSRIFCSSCHGSDGQNAPAGPHGSFYPRILKANYNLDETPQMGSNWPFQMVNEFALCFECHDVSAVTNIHTDMSGGHFMETIGCNACHDPHGYEGGTYSENRYGINFDRNVIQPNPLNGKMIDLDQKKCFMSCHDSGGVVNYTHSQRGDAY